MLSSNSAKTIRNIFKILMFLRILPWVYDSKLCRFKLDGKRRDRLLRKTIAWTVVGLNGLFGFGKIFVCGIGIRRLLRNESRIKIKITSLAIDLGLNLTFLSAFGVTLDLLLFEEEYRTFLNMWLKMNRCLVIRLKPKKDKDGLEIMNIFLYVAPVLIAFSTFVGSLKQDFPSDIVLYWGGRKRGPLHILYLMTNAAYVGYYSLCCYSQPLLMCHFVNSTYRWIKLMRTGKSSGVEEQLNIYRGLGILNYFVNRQVCHRLFPQTLTAVFLTLQLLIFSLIKFHHLFPYVVNLSMMYAVLSSVSCVILAFTFPTKLTEESRKFIQLGVSLKIQSKSQKKGFSSLQPMELRCQNLFTVDRSTAPQFLENVVEWQLNLLISHASDDGFIHTLANALTHQQ